MKITAIATALVFAAASSVAVAGVAPNSAASQSGAKVAPAKNDTQSQSNGETGSGTSTTK